GARSIQLSYEDLYKIDDFGSFFELTADMSFPPGGWSAITLGGGRSILLSYVDNPSQASRLRRLSYYTSKKNATAENEQMNGHVCRLFPPASAADRLCPILRNS
ncbi:MAG: hypothetical protein IJJ25_01870, partial [Lachnospiraceae bacterium]|nr:hypothetical protein [Lachnospiraceae bacterium]